MSDFFLLSLKSLHVSIYTNMLTEVKSVLSVLFLFFFSAPAGICQCKAKKQKAKTKQN
jgi:hypothetical protein